MTNLAPGKLGVFFYNAIVLTIPASLILLAWYRRSVTHSMRASTGHLALPWSETTLSAGRRSMHVEGSTAPRALSTKGRPRRLILIYTMGGLVAAAVMAFLFALSMDFDLTGRAFFSLWYVYAWPIVPSVVTILAWPQRRNISLFLLYAVVGAAVVSGSAWVSAHALDNPYASPTKSARLYAELLIRQMWLPYLIILITGSRRLRPVSPLALAGLLIFSFGSLLARDLYLAAVDAFAHPTWLLFPGSVSYQLWYLPPALVIGYLCWLMLKRLAQWFDKKRFSDTQMLVDSWWFIVAFQFSTELANTMGWAGLAGLLAFVGYRGTVQIGLHLSHLRTNRHGPTLLLLRVFGFQRRTERLFDTVAQRWRFNGPVLMIAGADLAMRTLSPGDIISFMSGHLASRFIANEQAAGQATAAIDKTMDPDGRYRITKFFCRDDTWRSTLTLLLDRSDAVLMDLRGFGDNNRGCLFELEQLVSHQLISRTLFIADNATNVALLEQTLRQQAHDLGNPESPLPQIQRLNKQSITELFVVHESLQRLVGHGPTVSQ